MKERIKKGSNNITTLYADKKCTSLIDADDDARLIERYGLDKSNYYRALRSLKKKGKHIAKVNGYYINTQYTQIRCADERDISFMQDDAERDDILYFSADEMDAISAKHRQQKSKDIPTLEEYMDIAFDYCIRYLRMSPTSTQKEAEYNYYTNPRISRAKRIASFSEGYAKRHNGNLPKWLPVCTGDAVGVCADDFGI